jgi:DNA-binding LytR/AlgR family response regulator
VEVALLSFFILILQIYRLRNSRLQQELEEVRAINQLLEERQENKSIDNEQLITDNESVACVIRGNTKNAVLEVIPEHIVYVESMSNYTDICYLEDDSLRHHSLRITMKQLRESLSPYQYIIPCHRAFLVNLNFVVSLSGRPSTGCSLQMFQVEKPIPVARSYTKDIHDRLQAG